MRVLHKPSEVPACVKLCVSDVCNGEREKQKWLMLNVGLMLSWQFLTLKTLSLAQSYELREEKGLTATMNWSVAEVKSTVPAQSTPSGARTQSYQVPFTRFLQGQAPSVRTWRGWGDVGLNVIKGHMGFCSILVGLDRICLIAKGIWVTHGCLIANFWPFCRYNIKSKDTFFDNATRSRIVSLYRFACESSFQLEWYNVIRVLLMLRREHDIQEGTRVICIAAGDRRL